MVEDFTNKEMVLVPKGFLNWIVYLTNDEFDRFADEQDALTYWTNEISNDE